MVEADVYPDFSAVTGGQLQLILGALLTIVLVVAVLMILICAIVWAVSSSHGNHTAVSKAKTGLWVGIGAAALAGAGVTWLNFLISLGDRL
ncbi:DUF6112 family protein [Microbacterium sp. JB110]|uniref:DUF6112 family protein n=1 Tax=Microbacterium sp. JB110 TaxID=2024477 RepID=UPI00097F221E|nr:DUF6112 family protein [Microbacterium sp. JB110]RCS61138.1 hypothetical protein CIK77_06320 [Microbacterium sp. JB110]SJM69740.1 hypothetical protein CZ774_17315 [Frigoribacterium sp. JB110]